MKKKSKREFAARVLIHNQSEYDFVAFVLIKKESRRELMTLMLKVETQPASRRLSQIAHPGHRKGSDPCRAPLL